MQPDHHIKVRADENEQLRCVICQELLLESRIALLIRLVPGGTFDPLCNLCAHDIIKAAMDHFTQYASVAEYLN